MKKYGGTTWRDSQKSKLYRAETRGLHGIEYREFETREEVLAYVESVTGTVFWTNRALKAHGNRWMPMGWGKQKWDREKVKKVSVVFPGNRHQSATGSWMRYEISLPNWAWNERVILHELAHVITDDTHGPQFAKMYLDLVRRFIGEEAWTCLRKTYLDLGIKFISRSSSKRVTQKVDVRDLHRKRFQLLDDEGRMIAGFKSLKAVIVAIVAGPHQTHRGNRIVDTFARYSGPRVLRYLGKYEDLRGRDQYGVHLDANAKRSSDRYYNDCMSYRVDFNYGIERDRYPGLEGWHGFKVVEFRESRLAARAAAKEARDV